MATPPDFSVGQVLTAANMNAVGLWLVKSQTIGAGVASVTVTDAFSADYDNYHIVISGGVGSTDANCLFRLGASVTGYYGVLSYATYATGSYQSATSNNSSLWDYVGYSSSNFAGTSFDLLSPFLTRYTQIITASGNFQGIHQVATSYTSFTWAPTAGTLTGGTIRVYGYRN
jgi:hypothetical protein